MSKLIKCKACGKEISKNAKACPNCGEAPRKTSAVTWIVTFFVVFWMIGYFASQNTENLSKTEISVNRPITGQPVSVEELFNDGNLNTPSTENISQSIETKSKWETQRRKSEMDDTPTFLAYTESTNRYKPWLGGPDTAVLMARCLENKTDVIFSSKSRFNVEYGKYNKAHIRYRIDDKKPVLQYWSESTSGESAFAKKPINLLKELKDAKQLTVEFIPFNSSPATVTFDISGFAPHVEEIARTCNWEP